MNGTIAQLVALACHGNSYLRGFPVAGAFFPGNSTCAFCDSIEFVEVKRTLFVRTGERVVARTPDEWFAYLKKSGVQGLRLSCSPQDDPRISDRVSAGFVGGGGDWMLIARKASSVDVWRARWEVWNQNAPEKKIWRVTYGLTASRGKFSGTGGTTADQRERFRSALLEIHAFSEENDCKGFTGCFQRALESLDSDKPLHGYHKDLCPDALVPEATRAVLDAAQSAWVFGGMGSWNDMGFDGEAGKRYGRVSDELFLRLREIICAAANESDRPAA